MNEILKPWYAIATPHEDIREGHLEEAVFAANVWAVIQEKAPEVYLDAEEFFRKTYLTKGLSTVLKRVTGGLRRDGETGNRIISLQTAFGGGKTHTLVALWHLARNANRLKESRHADGLRKSVGGQLPEGVKGVAVFTNQTCDATRGRRVGDGVHLRTLWGELAYQLGGKALYERVRANDESRCVPQGLFSEILRDASPCLILLDELADYCVGAAAMPVGDSSLMDQTVSFIQQLTESVQQVPGAVMVATLPAKTSEVAHSDKVQETLMMLKQRFRRLGADVQPVADEEIYEIVRYRLFESIKPPDYPRKVARVYQEMYAKKAKEVPSEAVKKTYRDQLQRAYPFHPLLIDALYTRWGSHPLFQRTRGVLRLLASIVGNLWDRHQGNTETQHFIQPCHIRWSVDALQATLTQILGDEYQSVAAADVNGDRSNAGKLDEEREYDYRREAMGKGLASAILLGSFGGQGSQIGFSSKDLRLAFSRQGLDWNYTDGVLSELEIRCFYLHTAAAGNLGRRYWFGAKPALNMLVADYLQRSAEENFGEEILENLRAEKPQKGALDGATWRVIVDPAEDLAEQRSLTLLVLPPSLAWNENGGAKDMIRERVKAISTRCGEKNRIYRNTLLFLVGTARGLNKLRKAHRERAALESVRTDYWSQLDEEQKEDLKKRLDAAHKAASKALGSAYTVALRVRGQEVEACALSDSGQTFREHLDYLWKALVEDKEWILRHVGSVTLESTGLIPKEGGLRMKDAVEAFLRLTDKPMVATKEAVTTGLAQACADGLVGVGEGGSPSNLQTRYCRQQVSLDLRDGGLWIIPPFTPEKVPGGEENTGAGVGDGEPGVGTPTSETSETATVTKPAKGTVRRFLVHGEIPGVEHWGELYRCFINPALSMNLKKLGLGVQFEMLLPEGRALDENDQGLKYMKESARQLGLKLEIEE